MVYPLLHLQSLPCLLPKYEVELAKHGSHIWAAVILEYLPSTHESHTTLPLDSLYFPATHAVQVFATAPSYPALHLQSVANLLFISEVD